jgi:hypothetical protein
MDDPCATGAAAIGSVDAPAVIVNANKHAITIRNRDNLK